MPLRSLLVLLFAAGCLSVTAQTVPQQEVPHPVDSKTQPAKKRHTKRPHLRQK